MAKKTFRLTFRAAVLLPLLAGCSAATAQTAKPAPANNTNVWFCPGFWCPTTATTHPEKNTANYPWSMMPLPQVAPQPKLCNPTRVQSFSVAGITVGLCDGSVRLVSKGVSQPTWGCAVDPADGRVLGDDW